MANQQLLTLIKNSPGAGEGVLRIPAVGDKYEAPRGVIIAPDTGSALTLTGGTVTTSNPLLTATQTWNAGGVTFYGRTTNITATASATLSRLESWQVGGVEVAGIVKDGSLFATHGVFMSAATSYDGANYHGLAWINGGALDFYVDGAFDASLRGNAGFRLASGRSLAWSSTASANGTADLLLHRDAAAVLNLRNSTTAQTLRVTGTYTNASNYEWLAITRAAITVETAGTGTDNIDLTLTPAGTGNVVLPGGVLVKTAAALTDGAGASAGTLANAPAVGNPTKWIPINDNGTTRYIPAW